MEEPKQESHAINPSRRGCWFGCVVPTTILIAPFLLSYLILGAPPCCIGGGQYIIESGFYGPSETYSFEEARHQAAKGRLNLLRIHLLLDPDKVDGAIGTSNQQYYLINSAVGSGRLNYVKLLVRRGANVNIRDWQGKTPLFFVGGRRQYLEVAELLIQKGADVNARDNEGNTPIFTKVGRLDLVQLLCEHGADVKLLNNKGETLFHMPGIDPGVVQFLLAKGLDPHISDNEGRTPLNVPKLKIESARLFLASGININSQDKHGKTPLHYAASTQGNDKLIQYLLEHGAEVDIIDDKEETPLFYAMRNIGDDGHVSYQGIKVLLEHGAQINARDKQGRTPLGLAKEEENWLAARCLKEHGATE